MINLNKKFLLRRVVIFTMITAIACLNMIPASGAITPPQQTEQTYIKWAEFNIPYSAMDKALNLDVKSHDTEVPLHWVEILSYLSAKYGGNWHSYKAKDMDSLVQKLKKGENIADLAARYKSYPYFSQVYEAVLGNFVGEYATETQAPDGTEQFTKKYGLKVFSPIAAGYGYGHYDDFGDSRSFGFARRHQGNDLLGTVGTPIIAVEGGYVESMGWNRYGGWRIGIRSIDKKRYYYYAHLRKGHPFPPQLSEGAVVRSGDVIGYLGMTGYSDRENVNGMQKPHLHFGMQLVFDESQKECNNELWINVYNIVNLLARKRSQVVKQGNDYTRLYDFIDMRYQLYYE